MIAPGPGTGQIAKSKIRDGRSEFGGPAAEFGVFIHRHARASVNANGRNRVVAPVQRRNLVARVIALLPALKINVLIQTDSVTALRAIAHRSELGGAQNVNRTCAEHQPEY